MYNSKVADLSYLRAQARAQAVEVRLADTTAELKNLKAKQHQLEMLLHSAHASKAHSSESGSTSAEVSAMAHALLSDTQFDLMSI